jgi:hypothetical protein
MYDLYTDKQDIFEANIDIQGASLDESTCRLLVESDKWNLIFNGELDKKGSVQIPIKKLKGLFSEGDVGKLKLEVIADDVYFTPWESDFTMCVSRKVVAEVKRQSKRNLPSETVKVTSTVKSKHHTKPVLSERKRHIRHLKELSRIFLDEGITIANLYENTQKLSNIIIEFTTSNDISSHEKEFLVDGILKVMSSRRVLK